jgi:hypothetical protein
MQLRGSLTKVLWAILGLTAVLLVSLELPMSREGKDKMIFDFTGGRSAQKMVLVQIPIASQGATFNRLKKFADENGFSFRNPRLDPEKEQYGIDLLRRDIAISGFNPFNEEEFKLGFYIDPKRGGTIETVNDMAGKLRDAVAPIAVVQEE